MDRIWSFIRGAWKAVVAAALPILTDVAMDMFQAVDIELTTQGLVTAVVTALGVYFKANK